MVPVTPLFGRATLDAADWTSLTLIELMRPHTKHGLVALSRNRET